MNEVKACACYIDLLHVKSENFAERFYCEPLNSAFIHCKVLCKYNNSTLYWVIRCLYLRNFVNLQKNRNLCFETFGRP